MREEMGRAWWALALRGVLALAVGLIALVWPLTTLYGLVLLFGAYALLDGAALLAHGFGRGARGRGWLILEGLAGVVAGLGAFAFPQITALALVYLVAVWAVVTGVFELLAAVSLRGGAIAWSLGVTGVLSLALGAFLLAAPGAGALAWVWVFAIYAIAAGVALLADALRLRGGRGGHVRPSGA